MENKDFIAYKFKIGELRNTGINTLPKDEIIKIQLFSTEEIFGSYFSCIYKGKLRIHVVFSEDSSDFNEEIECLMQETIKRSNISEGKIWISNKNSKIIEYLNKQMIIALDSESFFYESYQLIMPREKFIYKFDKTILDARPYEEEHIDEYLLMLYNSMSFKIPPYNYILEKEKFLTEFRRLREINAFEAFWKNEDLVGLYWLEGTEIDHLAIAEKYQRSGYGKQILTKAMETVFQNPEIDYAWLLVVGWNIKAFRFYQKYGMEEKALFHVSYNDSLE